MECQDCQEGKRVRLTVDLDFADGKTITTGTCGSVIKLLELNKSCQVRFDSFEDKPVIVLCSALELGCPEKDRTRRSLLRDAPRGTMLLKITDEQLVAIMPNCANVAVWCEPLNVAMERFEINNEHRIAAFLAQIAHESGCLQRLVVNLNYTAKRLMAVWPTRFPELAKAIEYERQPEKLANYVYANRLGNGDAASGDGWRFCGRGLIQVTGRANYHELGSALGLPLEQQPQLLEQPGPAALSAASFWKSHLCNALADDENNDNDEADFVAITKKINGGTAGLSERRAYWLKAKQVFAIT